MPSIATYTPYESLLFFQSVARHGADSAAFEDISTALNENEFIRDSATYDNSRLTAAALQGLYDELVTAEINSTKAETNGHAPENGTNPRKRKLSPEPEPLPLSEDGAESRNRVVVQALVDRLYARYKEQVVREIEMDEEQFAKLQEDIKVLTDQITTENPPSGFKDKYVVAGEPTQSVGLHQPNSVVTLGQKDTPQIGHHANPTRGDGRPSPVPTAQVSMSSMKNDVMTSGHAPTIPLPTQQTPPRGDGASGVNRSPPESFARRHSQPPPPLQHTDHPVQHSSPSAFHHRTLPPPSPQRANYGPISTQHGFPHGSPVPMLPLVPGMPAMPPPVDYSGHHRRTPSGQNRGSPLPYHQQPPYPGYPPYPHPGPWPQQVQGPVQHPYQPQSPYANAQFYGQPQLGRPPPHMQTPVAGQFQPYPQPAPPTQFKGQPAWHGPMGQPWTMQIPSSSSTPVARPRDHSATVRRSGSSTPWKRKPETVGALRPSSPVRPDRDVSPLTDRGSPAPDLGNEKNDGTARPKSGRGMKFSAKKGEAESESRRGSRPTRRSRAGSTGSSAAGPSSRSQSIASFASDRQDRVGTGRGRGRRIKNELPSTPAPFPSDSEPQRSSGRRGRTRNDAITSYPATTNKASKRKRSSANYSSPTPSLLSPHLSAPIQHGQTSIDPSCIAISKNFARTANLLLGEITAHKVAGIFSKPLTERDAPGYKNLILRPQDLKSIKAAVNRGSRAVTAAIEETENRQPTKGDAEETPTKANFSSAGTSAGIYVVNKTDELVPPKGIVSSAQLEMELVRTFANAVMFNPLAAKERGFGGALKLMRDGGLRDEGEMGEDAEGGDTEDGRIAWQTREMCKDALDLVAKYRSLEDDRIYAGLDDAGMRGAMARTTPATTALRAGSVSMSVNSPFPDDGLAAVEDGDGGATGTGRKRRKIAEG